MDYDLWLLQNDDTESYYVADMTILVTYIGNTYSYLPKV